MLPAAKPLPPSPGTIGVRGTDHLHLLPRIPWAHSGGPGAPETPLLGPAAAGGAQRVKPVTAAATQLPGDPTGTGTPGCPVPPTHTPRRRFIGSGAVQRCCPPRDPARPRPPTLPLCAAGPWSRGGDAGTHTSSWPPKGEGSQAAPRHPSRGAPRRLPACPSALPGPGALCLPAIFGSLLRAPLRLLIMRVRNSFGLSYIRKGRGLEAAKYTGACGSERGGFGSECGKGIV